MKNGMFSIAMAIAVAIIIASSGLVTVAATGSYFTPANTGSNENGTLYISPGPTPAFVDNFNPFNMWSEPSGIMSLFYEPLLQINTYNGTTIPWLATSYEWSNNNTLLTLNLRHNVHFSDGIPFNSSDVVFTFNLQKKLFGEWGNINNIYAVNQYTVNFNFSKPDTQCLFYLGSDFMLPEKLWQNVSDPASKIITNPVGTGPYVLSSFSGQKIVLTANKNYWMSGEPKIKRIVYVDYTSNSALTLAMAQGKVDWTSVFAPNITTLFVSKDPKYNHYYFPPGQPVTLITNDAVYPFNLSYFRQAISLSINRTEICQVGEYGYEKPANAANILAQQMFWLNSTNAKMAEYLSEYNPSAAIKLLEKHGFTLKSGRLYNPNGTEIPALTIMSVAGYTDWDTDISIIASELSAIGLKVNIETPTSSVVASDIATGNFEMAQDTVTGIGPNPWYDYSGLVGSLTPIGKTAYINEERWNYTSTNFMKYYDEFPETSNVNTEKKLINDMAGIMLDQMPMIPLVYSADWYEYVNRTIGGFPNQNNGYWIPMPWYPGPMEVVLMHLYVKNSIKKSNNYLPYEVLGAIVVIIIIGAVASLYLRKKRNNDR
ncbi:ABC transporter substrate-binding protein [Picrophilus oshimae]|uniref:Peptide/nickel transport system substrate-binding protein n=1 Tax=Picrophilus torridus (strain ATCC 700027 / DSM 9790 / JCM 10055 / NBRC 100828 / KAW 2/3) TaxID=1122961 RepID=A0A8G2FWP6_PICTO|nr:ABC transporter substrate-binding protein [Picrophilus oshimae]SMD30891.1 peptide/nickel transport system substrate-binding protein [Picrophilus oshimae DSM 9789]